MARLVEALRARGLAGHISLSGRWVARDAERGRVHADEATKGAGYDT